MRFIPDRSKANLYEAIMTSLLDAIKWPHEGSMILIFISAKEIMLCTGKSSLGSPLIQ